MSSQNQAQHKDNQTPKQRTPQPKKPDSAPLTNPSPLALTIQRAQLSPNSLTSQDMQQLQRAIGNHEVQRLLTQTSEHQPIQKKENHTGLPDRLKSGVESLSGVSMDDVQVHYNSSKPAQLQALAYTQGSEIHVETGQEEHLPHEAWHVVQQKQGRVQPTVQMKDASINDDRVLEQEADVMGAKALSQSVPQSGQPIKINGAAYTSPNLQAKVIQRLNRTQKQALDRIKGTVQGETDAEVRWRLIKDALDLLSAGTDINIRDGAKYLKVTVSKPVEETEETYSIETDEDRAAVITTVDDNDKVIGPFNGGRGSRSEVPPSDGAVYYDLSRKYCISVDNSSHAGDGTWKLFIHTKRGWQRLDTLWPDGRRMYRG